MSPDDLNLDLERLVALETSLERLCRNEEVTAASVVLGRRAGAIAPRCAGTLGTEPDAELVGAETLFLVASLAKPVTATAILILLESGRIGLDDPVAEYLPEFGCKGKEKVRIRHLLTHTSGLPDMTPSNLKLRQQHAPLSAFLEEIMTLPLAFEPGTRVSYQSTGFALMSELVLRITGEALPKFLDDAVFRPLGMHETSLGYRPATVARIAPVQLEPEQVGTDWNWNTPYWLGFGAPWGGLLTTAADYARFCRVMLNGGTLDGNRILSPATVRAAASNQLIGLAVPEADRGLHAWGLGWRLNWPGNSAHFGDLLGPRTFGHWGATGTLCWMDPDVDAFAVIFTTRPGGDEGRHLARLSNQAASVFLS